MLTSMIRESKLHKYADKAIGNGALAWQAGQKFPRHSQNPVLTAAPHQLLEDVMKKRVKKLELNKETVRNLTRDDLKKVVGGTTTDEACTRPRTACLSCVVGCYQ